MCLECLIATHFDSFQQSDLHLGAHHLTLEEGGGVGDFEKKFPASACRKKKIACSTNVIESLWEKKGKKYPAHQIARKKNSWWPEITHPTPQKLNGRPLTLKCFIKKQFKLEIPILDYLLIGDF